MDNKKMETVLITGIKNEFDAKLASAFISAGFSVYTIGENSAPDGVIQLPPDLSEAVKKLKGNAGYIDIYIDTSDERSPSDNFNIQVNGLNIDVMRKLYDSNVIVPMSILEAFLPLLENGEKKRLCFLTSAEASINETRGTDGYGYKMAKAALHNFLQITRNALAPKGYLIRAFDPMYNEVPPKAAAQAAYNYFTRRRGIERGDERRDDEGNLVMRDANGRQHAW